MSDSVLTILSQTKRIAVLGCKPDTMPDQPAHYVPKYMQMQGYEIIPVPVYYPQVTQMLGVPVIRDLAAVPRPVELVNVFRRPEDIAEHTAAMLQLKPRWVWFQSGIRNDAVAAQLQAAGIGVVQDTCLMVAHRMVAHQLERR